MSEKSYESADITVTFDSDICQHAGECVRGLPAVFEVGRKPWIIPNAAPAEKIAEVIERCPSKALKYQLKK